MSEVLWEWISVLERTTRVWTEEEDAAWFYNERASLSIFAGAIWRVGGVALEEFYMLKGNARKISPGRADLYFDVQGRDFLAEAKQVWTGSGLLHSPVPRVNEALHAAVNDVSKCDLSYSCDRLGIVFAVPGIGLSKASSLEEHVSRWLTAVQTVKHDAIAWVFPAAARNKRWRARLYPGTAILIRQQR